MSLLVKSGCLQTMTTGLKPGHAIRRPHGWGYKTVGSIISIVDTAIFSHIFSVTKQSLPRDSFLNLSDTTQGKTANKENGNPVDHLDGRES